MFIEKRQKKKKKKKKEKKRRKNGKSLKVKAGLRKIWNPKIESGKKMSLIILYEFIYRTYCQMSIHFDE